MKLLKLNKKITQVNLTFNLGYRILLLVAEARSSSHPGSFLGACWTVNTSRLNVNYERSSFAPSEGIAVNSLPDIGFE